MRSLLVKSKSLTSHPLLTLVGILLTVQLLSYTFRPMKGSAMLPLGLRRRFSLTTLTTLLLFFSPLGSGDTSIQVSVQANQAWTDTGIDLTLGSNVTITAK
jgi:hypothetical protein